VNSELRNAASACLQKPKCKGSTSSWWEAQERETVMPCFNQADLDLMGQVPDGAALWQGGENNGKGGDLGQKRASCKKLPTEFSGNPSSKAPAFAGQEA